ncbi:g4313 [Coccomyxa viridis]|uniref:Copper homeostasis protein cutC homolog n=1 Tax=Coccomyxa viridis TaxID=1274662 RepID=A0ABP1FQ01_9CHLO
MVAPAPKAGIAVEFCVDSLSSALSAQTAGAARVELCCGLSCGGLTPSAGLIKAVRAALRIPLHVLIRPRAGDFLYDEQELLVMREDITAAAELGANGIVAGVLTREGEVHVPQLSELILLCRSLDLDFTFHRSFDMVRSQREALEALISCGVPRVLTSGGSQTALQGSMAIAALVRQARGRISVMAGGGVRPKNVESLVRLTGVSVVHSACSRPVESRMWYRTSSLRLGSDEDADWTWAALDEAAAFSLAFSVSLELEFGKVI